MEGWGQDSLGTGRREKVQDGATQQSGEDEVTGEGDAWGGQQTPTRLPVGLNAVGKGVIDIVLTKMALASQLEMGQEQAGRQAGCLWDDSGAY